MRFRCYNRWLTLSLVYAWNSDAFQVTPNGPRRPSIALKDADYAGAVTPLSSPFLSSSVLQVAGSQTETVSPTPGIVTHDMPQLGDDGLYHIENQAQHAAFLQSVGQDRIVVLKVYAPWCRACKGLEPKFYQIANDPKYENLPIVWADLTIQHNKDFIKQLGVLALPTVQFYVKGQLLDTFPCGPSKVPILKRKLAALVNQCVDAKTRALKPDCISEQQVIQSTTTSETESLETSRRPRFDEENSVQAAVAATKSRKVTPYSPSEGAVVTPNYDTIMPAEEREEYRRKIPYLQEMSLADCDELLDRAKLLTFEPGSIIMREGHPGRTFYILRTGQVEVCQETLMDPLVAPPPSYLGTVVNILENRGDYFGERALMTGEPRVASIRATDQVTCWALDRSDFPDSSVLSGRTRFDNDDGNVNAANEKYGVSLRDLQSLQASWQERAVGAANQVRGSTNSPQIIRGVDTEEDVEDAAFWTSSEASAPPQQREPANDSVILSLLSRFKVIRQVRRCFEYIVATKASWGDKGSRVRRSLLVSRLTPAQRAEFAEAFEFIDANGDGTIELLELKRVMQSTMEDAASDEELSLGLEKALLNGRAVFTLQDFIGVMAEAEFYYLFNEIFSSLDKTGSGYVKAKDLDRVLSGVRDLISDDRNSIIDVEDMDMHIDYEQFTRMLLGTSLRN